MKQDVKIRVLFKPGKSNRPCTIIPLLGELIETERLELAVQCLMAENLYHIHDKSQNRSVALISGLIQNRCDKGWVWIKGTIGQGPMKGQTHYWLEYDGWAIESTDLKGSVLTESHAILVMDASVYRKEMKLKAVTVRKSKQVSQWLTKKKKKRSGAMQPPKPPVTPSHKAPSPQNPPAPEAPITLKTTPKATEASPEKSAEISFEIDLGAMAKDLAAIEDKALFKERLMGVMATLKENGITQTEIVTVFLKEKVPTRSGRGTWNPRMVGDIFKQI